MSTEARGTTRDGASSGRESSGSAGRGTPGGSAGELGSAAREAAGSTALRRLAQLGLVAYALLHLLVAWLALQLAFAQRSPARNGRRSTDSSGALVLIDGSTGGFVLLWVLAVGLAGLSLWQAVEVVRHHRRIPSDPAERRSTLVQLVKTVGSAILYGYLSVSAVRTALGHGRSPQAEQHTVRGVLSWPGGQAIVVVVGLVVVVIGGYSVQKGWRSAFLDEIDLDALRPAVRTAAHRASQAGFVLKGIALVLVGAIVSWAAIAFDPRRADGLDGAMRAVARQPYGQWALTAIAIGLAAFAVYCVARARHPVG